MIFSSKRTIKCLAVGLRLNPLGKLTALPQTLQLDLGEERKGKRMEMREGKGCLTFTNRSPPRHWLLCRQQEISI